MSNNFGYLDLILLAMIAGLYNFKITKCSWKKNRPSKARSFQVFQKKNLKKFKKTIKLKKQPTEFDTNQKKQFLKGAEIAYETIINSFAKGDKKI
jgi:hypothetical protein